MKSTKALLGVSALALGILLSSFSSKQLVGELVWFEETTNYPFEFYGTIPAAEDHFEATIEPSEVRKAVGYDESRRFQGNDPFTSLTKPSTVVTSASLVLNGSGQLTGNSLTIDEELFEE